MLSPSYMAKNIKLPCARTSYAPHHGDDRGVGYSSTILDWMSASGQLHALSILPLWKRPTT
jgi:hypothetical protein